MKRGQITIQVRYDPPPIPSWELMAWGAWIDGEEEKGTEFGSTMREAVDRLMEREEDGGVTYCGK